MVPTKPGALGRADEDARWVGARAGHRILLRHDGPRTPSQLLDRRVRDGVLHRTINKWLKAGVLEAGELRYEDAGTPQGGVISPLLANVYLHEVLDTWFATEVKPRLPATRFS